MITPFILSAIAGFVAMGVHRYVVSPGWNIPLFLKTEPRVFIKSLLFAAVAVYFAHDIAALLPCGCGVDESTPGRTRIVLQDPRVIAAQSDSAEVRAACEQARASLRRVVDRLVASA